MATLASVRTLVRQRADIENSQHVKDAELNAYINASYAELYDLLTSRFEDYYSKNTTTTAAGTSTIALPADFYKMRGIDFQTSAGNWTSVRTFNFAERNTQSRLNDSLHLGIKPISYRVMGQNIQLLPEGAADGTYRVWYIPRFTPLVSDSDVLSDILDFEEYIVVDCAIKCAIKSEDDVSALMATKEQLKNRVINMSSNRDAGQPERIADVSSYSPFNDLYFPRG
jgi:hypothetical protein